VLPGSPSRGAPKEVLQVRENRGRVRTGVVDCERLVGDGGEMRDRKVVKDLIPSELVGPRYKPLLAQSVGYNGREGQGKGSKKNSCVRAF